MTDIQSPSRPYTYAASDAAFARAAKVIPGGVYGHLSPTEGMHIPRSAFPKFSSHAQGTRFWDLDGNEFIDYMCGYGPNVLGYGDPDVAAAADVQARKEDTASVPSVALVDFAEVMVDTVASADWAFFAKNGGDVTTLAIMTARAATARRRIVFFSGYYHGVDPWAQKLDYPGVLPQDVGGNIEVKWNDIDSLRETFAEHRGEIAALIAQPYQLGNFADNELPAPGFWAAVRALCDEHGVVLIVDDVRAGFRLDLAGSDHHYGFSADLICFCKAIANGYNVSALCGRESLRSAVSSITYTGSYWMSAVPFAAGMATIAKLKELDAPALFRELGTSLTEGLVDVAAGHGLTLVASGEPALFYLRIADDPSLMLHQRWIAECVRRGVFLTSHHNHFINAALTSDDIVRTLEVADEAFDAIV
ncbi:aminotransferase class III-fold pyridoxal phosphate-dependent enzyme [Gordonia polyisoprenivorans]|uniref:aminotransferase class III-fold pyridoxal phosphate-dependent enzyme n=1 Tax=Gordonia polyisoprenivorans TaxID=84595 RepID=UPI001B8B4788|nr:aminotransferase class III-fold pyridoxal phosphate-dependent enzyme [Gordonia polyisoprenivorans]QUD83099.1 aminotransferase class III-fold pyridoxal phosphate-dependent enzyme [Gordonia polyisoprenivorans]WCB37118.1 aminotransferase class III-fold pyridoxal phosphate-dependent enzyme [Gordonia polyisoprenivorans]